MNFPDLENTMMFIFGAKEWRETFIRTSGSKKEFRKWLYKIYLKSNAWRIKSSQRKLIDGSRCQAPLCFRVDSLQVHHTTYANIGDEDVENDLVTLCERCHKAQHGIGEIEELFPNLAIQLPSDVPDFSDQTL